MKPHTTPLHIALNDGNILVINRWYQLHEFLIHRTVGDYNQGWTITHKRSHMAILQKVRTRGQCVKLVGEFRLLSQKWGDYDSQKSMTQILSHRERGAIQELINQVRFSRKWSFR